MEWLVERVCEVCGRVGGGGEEGEGDVDVGDVFVCGDG